MEKTDIYAFIGARIRQERKARGLTLEELSSLVGMNTSFLHYIERNKRKPSLVMVKKIADALGVPLDQLFRGAPVVRKPEIAFAGKLSVLVKDADSKKRGMALRVLKSLLKDS